MGKEGIKAPLDSPSSTGNPILTRPSLKSHSQFNWKLKLRENCYNRVREDRSRLLWRLRTSTLKTSHSQQCSPQQQEVDIVRSAFEDIVSDEFQKMKGNSTDTRLFDSEMDDIWEYDGVHSSCQGECEDILLEMQRIFYEDLDSYPPMQQDLENELDTWEDEVDEYLASAVFEHMQLNEDKAHKEEIWCPICKRGELKEDHKLIYCTHCELRLNKASELTLGFLRERLAEAHTEHLDRGCRLKPKFCVKTQFSLTALYISCEGCETFEVVI
ncbi:hypothetical protein HN51_026970 [Arachis hypogaea]|uniref:RPA-interacting protein C-terminal domain-containing protein n=1 Tax=Arachis hypogaea TaxID=3818 RepID=A0A445BPV2_ARAHY|nr:uncharacterized protein LOC112709933 isoform X1 [Arachis hypogaea]QHO33226.1 uncharacterized protein DS421_9g256480 [Arachis hypogaea]RYR40707.1 hypothetical protein Ahy_A09g046443 [Arachis hypogaea]